MLAEMVWPSKKDERTKGNKKKVFEMGVKDRSEHGCPHITWEGRIKRMEEQ